MLIYLYLNHKCFIGEHLFVCSPFEILCCVELRTPPRKRNDNLTSIKREDKVRMRDRVLASHGWRLRVSDEENVYKMMFYSFLKANDADECLCTKKVREYNNTLSFTFR